MQGMVAAMGAGGAKGEVRGGELLTAQEVAVRLKCCRRTVYRLIRDGKLPCISITSARNAGKRVLAEDLERYISQLFEPV